MILNGMKEKSLEFVVRHYRKGAFSADKAWHRMGFAIRKRWNPFKVAAVVASVIAVTAVASVIIHNEYAAKENPSEIVVEQTLGKKDVEAVKSIDFDNAPLLTVVEEIENVYGVEVEGLPEDSATLHLTLHYEGNVKELLSAINDLLGTKLTVKE